MFNIETPLLGQAFVGSNEGSLIFSSPQFLVALLAGVLMTVAFQLLLTNFSVAVGISSEAELFDDDTDTTVGGQIRRVEAKAGAWALTTSSIALFVACFLAVKLSLISSVLFGATLGVVIWSSYFLLVMWLGTQAVGSLIGSLVSTANSGMQKLIGTATAGLGANFARKQAVSTAEEVTAAVRRELTSGLDADSLKNTLQSSLTAVELPKLDLKNIRQQFDKLLQESDLKSLVDSDLLKNIDRQTFVNLISSRTDFSKEEINRIADQLEDAWKSAFNQKPAEQVSNLREKTSSEESRSEQVDKQLQQLATVGGGNGGKQGNGLMKQAIQAGIGAAITAVLERADLSSLDVEKVTAPLKQINETTSQKIKEQLPQNAIAADVEDYLQNTFPWHFNRITIQNEFKNLIYDPDADPGKIRRQLENLNVESFTNLLKQRGDLSEEKVREIAEQLESIRSEVLETVGQSESSEKKENLRSRVENYLRSTGKEELNPEAIERDFATLLDDPETSLENLQNRLSQFDRDTLVQLLAGRQDFSEEEANNTIAQLERTRDNVINRATEAQEQAKAKANELRQRVEDYLRNTNKEELNPDAIERELRMLLEDPQAGLSALRQRLSQFDRDTFVQLLSQRGDLSEEEVNRLIDRAISVRDNLLQAPQKVADTARERYEQTTQAIADYLRNTNLEELDPEGIQRDLEQLFNDPKEGTLALRDRFSQVDRETLVKLLTQQGNLSEEQVNQTIDRVQQGINNIVKAPRRLANRTVQQAVDFEKSLENYLRNTNKEELNPEGIKRDLQLLLSSPRAGLSFLSDRVSQFDRSTMVALLSQREDISEEEANQIVDRIESVRNSIVEQYEQAKQKAQAVIDGIFEKTRNYLNSLDRPELNYEGLQKDFAKLFDDPQVGFEALKDRLSQVDRDTLVAILSSREDISEAQANRIVDRLEATRDSVLHRAERIQQETQKRLQAIKTEAKKQAEETKKVVADAAWWLFNTAFVSLFASAIAGILAVKTAF